MFFLTWTSKQNFSIFFKFISSFSDLVASFLESNGNNVERTIDFLLNNQGGFDMVEEEPRYQQQRYQEPPKKKEVVLSGIDVHFNV